MVRPSEMVQTHVLYPDQVVQVPYSFLTGVCMVGSRQALVILAHVHVSE